MPYRLLIVDDEIDLTNSLKEYFELKGFIVATCPSGEEAIAILRQGTPDIVILDVLLKDKLDGVDVLREARKINPAFKIVMCTGSDTTAKEKEILGIGVSRYLRKPVTVKELHNAVTEALNGN